MCSSSRPILLPPHYSIARKLDALAQARRSSQKARLPLCAALSVGRIYLVDIEFKSMYGPRSVEVELNPVRKNGGNTCWGVATAAEAQDDDHDRYKL